VSQVEWYERWFGEEYLALYPHRDQADAAAAIALLERRIGPSAGGLVLDLACGAGRHVGLLRRFGWTVGLDLSQVLLGVARANDPDGPYVRADMRVLPFASGSFALVTNLFTSFGYFASDDEHSRVLDEVRHVLRPSGTFVLDYFNSDYVRDNLVECDEREVSGRRIEQRRSITPDGRFVVKRIVDSAGGQAFLERVRLFTPGDLASRLHAAGFSVDASFGDYSGAPLSRASARAIFFARRP
jgi:SAM-dependent methyltransferase